MFFLVFVLFTSRWSVRKVLDCFFNMHLCAKLQPYSSNNFDLYGWKCFYKRLKQNELVVFNAPRSHGELYFYAYFLTSPRRSQMLRGVHREPFGIKRKLLFSQRVCSVPSMEHMRPLRTLNKSEY